MCCYEIDYDEAEVGFVSRRGEGDEGEKREIIATRGLMIKLSYWK